MRVGHDRHAEVRCVHAGRWRKDDRASSDPGRLDAEPLVKPRPDAGRRDDTAPSDSSARQRPARRDAKTWYAEPLAVAGQRSKR